MNLQELTDSSIKVWEEFYSRGKQEQTVQYYEEALKLLSQKIGQAKANDKKSIELEGLESWGYFDKSSMLAALDSLNKEKYKVKKGRWYNKYQYRIEW